MKQDHYFRTHLLKYTNSVFKTQAFQDPPLCNRTLSVDIVLPVMFFRRLFIAPGPKYYFGNPDWHVKWLGTVDRLYPSGIWT
jgi:hypothetical protein